MKLPSIKKDQATNLRLKGFSIKEIAQKIGISQSTASNWMRDISLNDRAKLRLEKRRQEGRLKAAEKSKKEKQERIINIRRKSKKELLKLSFSKTHLKLLNAFLFWGEGNKSGEFVSFINSDPIMIKVFLKLLRSTFSLDESKFRALVHMHEYHDEAKLRKYWSGISDIPVNQFSKSYLKPNTGKRKKSNYKGSLRVRYYDVQVARELTALYNTFSDQLLRGIG